MLDFTTSHYLGLLHPWSALSPWRRFSIGAPAALDEPATFKAVAQSLANLQGCEASVVAPSTLHLFWDLFGFLGRRGNGIYWDEGIYPIARWGVERAAGRGSGATMQCIPHYDPSALRRLLAVGRSSTRPIMVTDGFCPACGRLAPVAEYLACVRERGGLLVIDDTQSLGIYGHSPGSRAPYGRGGGGILRWLGVHGPDIIVIASLAKGFSAPMAVLSSSGAIVSEFETVSETRVHCSPPSVAVVDVAQRAVTINRQRGDELRMRLAMLVKRFRRGVESAGFALTEGIFPMQTLNPMAVSDGVALHTRLGQAGVKTVLQQIRKENGARLTFIITALHQPFMIDQAVDILQNTIRRKSKGRAGALGGGTLPKGCTVW